MNPVLWLALLPPLLWSGNAVIGRGISSFNHPLALSLWRWVLTVVLVLPWVIRPLWQQRQLLRQHWGEIVLLSLLSVASYNTLLYAALAHTQALNATLIGSALPLMSWPLAVVMGAQRPNRWSLAAMLLCLSGVLVVISQGQWQLLLHLQLNRGDVLMLLATAAWALYSALLRRRRSPFRGVQWLGLQATVGTVVLVGIDALMGQWFERPPTQWSADFALAVVFTALGASVVAYLCWEKVVMALGAPQAALFSLLVPALTALMASVFLGEALHPYHGLGMVLVVLGLVLDRRAGIEKPAVPVSQ